MRPLASTFALALTTLVPAVAAAHIRLDFPAPRTTELKAGPCGAAGSTRGSNVQVLEPGSTCFGSSALRLA